MDNLTVKVNHDLSRYITLQEYIQELKDILDEIPVEYQNKAMIDIDIETDYDCHTVQTDIYYNREKTPLEKRKDDTQKIRESKKKEREERNMLNRLLKKYGGK